MKKIWTEIAWQDYLLIQQDKKLLKKTNDLIKNIERTPFEGLGKPKALKGDLSGYWSRRIDQENRIVYKIEDNSL